MYKSQATMRDFVKHKIADVPQKALCKYSQSQGITTTQHAKQFLYQPLFSRTVPKAVATGSCILILQSKTCDSLNGHALRVSL